MTTIDTRFHGPITISDQDIITLDWEILGFPRERRYILLPHRADSPFLYLQSVDRPDLAFICIDPLVRVRDYHIPSEDIPRDLGPSEEWAVLCLCTIQDAQHGTINLRSPLVINRVSRRGGQFVLSVPYPIHYPLFSEEPSHAGSRP